MLESILHYNPDITVAQLADREAAAELAQRLGIKVADADGLGKIQTEIFEKTVEDRLLEPTFITAYPGQSHEQFFLMHPAVEDRTGHG